MIHNGIHVLENISIKNAGLAQRNPIFEAGIGKNCLSLGFADCIMVINADLNRVAGSAPMDGSVSVSGLGNGSDINNLDCIGIRLSLNSVNNVFHSSDVCEKSFFREIVRCRRNKTANVKNVIRALDALKNVFINSEVAPNDSYAGIVHVWSKEISVFLAVSEEDDDIIHITSDVKLLKACEAHRSRCAGEKNCLFH